MRPTDAESAKDGSPPNDYGVLLTDSVEENISADLSSSHRQKRVSLKPSDELNDAGDPDRSYSSVKDFVPIYPHLCGDDYGDEYEFYFVCFGVETESSCGISEAQTRAARRIDGEDYCRPAARQR